MPLSEEGTVTLEPCDNKVLEALLNFISCYTSTIQNRNLRYYCRWRGTKNSRSRRDVIDVFTLYGRLEEYISPRQSEHYNVISVGIHVARIIQRHGRLSVIPMLGLAQLLRVYAKIIGGYVKVTEHGERLFLYGRDVFPESITEFKEPLRHCDIVIVLNKYGEPLGWGRIAGRGNSIYIQNLIDAGWYLRSGV
jgi:ribosome biogenesis protein Nip4